MSDTIDDRSLLGIQPLSGAGPALADGEESQEYQQFQTEVTNLQNGGPGGVDWTLMIRACEGILRHQAKDCKVAAYYAFALFRREGYPGLLAGLTVIRDMTAHHWDSMLPKRVAVRANTLKWLVTRLAPLISATLPPLHERAALEECRARLGEIEQGMAAHDLAVSMHELAGPLGRLAAECQRAAAAAAAAAKPVETTPAAPEPATDALPGPPPPPPIVLQDADAVTLPQGADVGQIETHIARTAAGVKTIARALLDARPADPRAYQMLRFASWVVLTQPPAHQAGKTQLASPPPDRVKALTDLVQAGKFREALPEIEKSFGNAPFWLDAHRLCATALAGLGPEYAAARKAVAGALGDLLRRFPVLVELTYQNGVPFADPLTRAWIADEILPPAAGGGGAAAWDAAAAEARGLAGQGKVAEAVALFVQGRRQADGERARLMWELAQARFCAEIGKPAVAIPILEHLDDLIDARGLDAWEPDAVIEASRLLLDCYRKTAPAPPAGPQPPGAPPPPRPNEARLARIAGLQRRLARLDLGEALTMIDA